MHFTYSAYAPLLYASGFRKYNKSDKEK